MYKQSIDLMEWDSCLIENAYFSNDDSRSIAKGLSERGIINILELREGIQIKTNSYVGRINIDRFQININPKIKGMPLYQLLNYAYRLRNLKLMEKSSHSINNYTFFDLIIYELCLEVTDLLYKGLQKQYIKKEEELFSPRGRIDINNIARQGGIVREKLPCIYFYRNEDSLLNQILLAGLRLGITLTTDPNLKIDLQNLCNNLEDQVGTIKITRTSLQSAKVNINRLTKRYEPAIEIIGILYESQSIELEDSDKKLPLRGYFFDMNLFFETLLGRLLNEYGSRYFIRNQFRLHDLFLYNPEYNPHKLKSPTPRPDFAIMHEGKVVKLVDAKYKDLWEQRIPSDMLYQLAIYATSGTGNKTATIIYPAVNDLPAIQKIDIKNPVTNVRIGQVALQPVNLVKIAGLLYEDEKELGRYVDSLL